MNWASKDETQRIIHGDCIEGLRSLPDECVHCCVTSPPYWGLRDYGRDGQIGLERTPEEYVDRMVAVFREVRRVLRADGTLWLNLGDSYSSAGGSRPNGSSDAATGRAEPPIIGTRKPTRKPKDLIGVPWLVAFALQSDGWWLRQDIIWHKPNPMPESVTDRCTKAHEYVFLMTKGERYFFDSVAIQETADRGHAGSKFNEGKTALHQQGRAGAAERVDTLTRNRRSVWRVSIKPYKGAHFATMPPDLVEPCILAGTSEAGCCEGCGAPLHRQTNRTKLRRPRPNPLTKRAGEAGTGNHCANDVAGVKVETTGWLPPCDCGAGVKPCVVLDPFAGSGTTMAVAARLGRNGIGCELNSDYISLAIERITPELHRQRFPLFGK